MVYDRNSREGGYSRGGNSFDYGRDYGGGRDYSYSSARDYQAAGRDDDRGGDYGRSDGGRDYGRGDYGRGDTYRGGQSYGRMDYGSGAYSSGHDRSEYGAREYGHQRYSERDRFGSGNDRGNYYGSNDRGGYGRNQARGDYGHSDYGRSDYGRGNDRSYGRQPQGYDYEDRGFFERAGDEVRSWFGDDEAERRREMDQRYDERSGRTGSSRHDDDYHSWRSTQVTALDRDYDDYRRENRSKFEQEFSSWRTNRQGQRDQLKQVKEHQEVVGSDGEHVGTVDKVKGDRIILTKNDKDAGGQHHSIPSNWITSVADKVTLNKSAADAKKAWEDEDSNSAMFGGGDNARSGASTGGQNLNRSFSGTY